MEMNNTKIRRFYMTNKNIKGLPSGMLVMFNKNVGSSLVQVHIMATQYKSIKDSIEYMLDRKDRGGRLIESKLMVGEYSQKVYDMVVRKADITEYKDSVVKLTGRILGKNGTVNLVGLRTKSGEIRLSSLGSLGVETAVTREQSGVDFSSMKDYFYGTTYIEKTLTGFFFESSDFIFSPQNVEEPELRGVLTSNCDYDPARDNGISPLSSSINEQVTKEEVSELVDDRIRAEKRKTMYKAPIRKKIKIF